MIRGGLAGSSLAVGEVMDKECELLLQKLREFGTSRPTRWVDRRPEKYDMQGRRHVSGVDGMGHATEESEPEGVRWLMDATVHVRGPPMSRRRTYRLPATNRSTAKSCSLGSGKATPWRTFPWAMAVQTTLPSTSSGPHGVCSVRPNVLPDTIWTGNSAINPPELMFRAFP